MRVSVIVAVRNGARFLGQALASVGEQSRAADELIVVDNGSEDGSRSIAESCGGARVVTEAEAGIAHARNRGIAEARGDVVMFLDQDDVWAREKVEVQAEYLERHPGVEYCVASAQWFLEPGASLRPGFRPVWFQEGRAAAIPGTLAARRELFERIGGFDPAYQVACDGDWFVRAQDGGAVSAELPDVLLKKRIHADNASARVDCYRREWLKVLMQSHLAKKARRL